MTSGAVAAGSRSTVEAGVRALEVGGNAVDAAVAAQLMACVAEPLLTGLGGSGLAMVRMDGRVEALDFFSAMPGLGREGQPVAPLTAVEIDFGPTTQTFHVGPASVAVPGTPAGLWALHQRYGRVPMTELVRPAVDAAQRGVTVDVCSQVVFEMLWPIERRTGQPCRLSGASGGPLAQGDVCRNPLLAPTLEQFAEEGPAIFRDGPAAQALLDALGDECRLTMEDLRRYEAVFRDPLHMRYRDADVWVPPSPSQGGPMVLHSLRALSDVDERSPFGYGSMERLAAALEGAAQRRRDLGPDALFEEGFLAGYLGAGWTTHMSVVDADGNAVSWTSSLGESCGVCVPETGIRPNNFLGEADVNPPGMRRIPGQRLMTMCSPTVASHAGGVFALGSGGSSRIRSALVHGLVYLVAHGLEPAQVVQAPRCHVEEGVLKTEVFGRPPDAVKRIRALPPPAVVFETYGMYFGGLHIAGMGPSGPAGAGDPRRSGAFASVPRPRSKDG